MPEILQFRRKPAPFHGVLYLEAQVIVIDGLGKKAVCPVLHGLDGHLYRAVRGNDDDRDVSAARYSRMAVPQPLKEPHARKPGHLVVDDDGVVIARLRLPERIDPVLRGINLVPLFPEVGGHDEQDIRLVVDNEKRSFHISNVECGLRIFDPLSIIHNTALSSFC